MTNNPFKIAVHVCDVIGEPERRVRYAVEHLIYIVLGLAFAVGLVYLIPVFANVAESGLAKVILAGLGFLICVSGSIMGAVNGVAMQFLLCACAVFGLAGDNRATNVKALVIGILSIGIAAGGLTLIFIFLI